MFRTETTRTRLLSVGVVVMLLLSGCASVTQSSPPAPAGGGGPPETMSTTTAPTTTATQPVSERSLHDYANTTAPGAANLSAQAQARAENLTASFYEGLPENQTERRQAGFTAAAKTCAKYQNLTQTVDLDQAAATGNYTRELGHKIAFATDIANEQFSDDIPVHSAKSLRDLTQKSTKYVPLISSFQTMGECACAATERRTDAALKDYYTATLMFGVDAMLVSTGAFYKPAFAGTRFVTNKASQVGLYRLRYVLGNRGWALAMSEVYYGLRGAMINTASSLAGDAAEIGWQLDEEGADIQLVAQMQGVNATRLTAATRDQGIPTNVSWSANQVNDSNTATVTIGNHTRHIAIPEDTNSSTILDYPSQYANSTDLQNTTQSLDNQSEDLTNTSRDHVQNATDSIADSAENASDTVANATKCANPGENSSDSGGFLEEAVEGCTPVGNDEDNNSTNGWFSIEMPDSETLKT